MEFKTLAELCDRLEKISKRNLMTSIVAEFLKSLNEDEIEPAVSMMLGRAFPKYESGMALRFARIIKVRDDKGPEEADTIGTVRRMYESQFQRKAKLNLNSDV
jgi:DNA ligase-1